MKKISSLTQLRNLYLCCIMLVATFGAIAQFRTEPGGGVSVPGPNGGRIHYSSSKDEFGKPTITEEHKDQNGKLTKKVVHTTTFDGDQVDTSFIYDDAMRVSKTIVTNYDGNNKPIGIETLIHSKENDTEIIGGTKESKDSDGKWHRQDWDPEKKAFTPISKNISPTNENYASCNPRATLIAAYSYLNSGAGATGFNMPGGAKIGAILNLNRNLGIIADVSYHSRAKGEQKFDREFALAGIQFKPNCTQNDPALYATLQLGYGRDGYRFKTVKNSAGGFAAAIGSGIDIPLNCKKGIRIGAEYIGNWIDGKMSGNLQVSAGLNLGLELRY